MFQEVETICKKQVTFLSFWEDLHICLLLEVFLFWGVKSLLSNGVVYGSAPSYFASCSARAERTSALHSHSRYCSGHARNDVGSRAHRRGSLRLVVASREVDRARNDLWWPRFRSGRSQANIPRHVGVHVTRVEYEKGLGEY